MKKLFICFLFTYFGFAQCPEETSIFINSQEDIDQFIINYPNCTEIFGDLVVHSLPNPFGESHVINLYGLQNIEKVHGNVVIKWCYHLSSLEGLNALKSIEGDLYISQNSILSTNNIFNNLVSIGGHLYFHSNSNMTAIDDFHNLESIGSSLTFTQNDYLLNIIGFENLLSIGQDLRIIDRSIENISGFSNLSHIGRDLYIADNFISSNNTFISSFENLESVGRNLTILNTASESVSWLTNLNSVGGNVWLIYNPNLEDLLGISQLSSMNGELNIRALGTEVTSLNGLENIDYTGINYLNISENQNLSGCSKPNICQYLLSGRPYFIQNNSSGCNSAEEILTNCNMSIDEEILNDKVTIFPNPAKDKLHIHSNNLIIQEIGLYSVEGKLLQKYNSKERILDVSKYPSGNYTLVIKSDKGKTSKKILITR